MARPYPSPYTLFDRLFRLWERAAEMIPERRDDGRRKSVSLSLDVLELRWMMDAARPLPLPVIFAGAGPGAEPAVRAYDAETGTPLFEAAAYGPEFRGGVRVAAGDLTGDGYPDVVVAPGPGRSPLVKVLDGKTGTPVSGPLGRFLAFDPADRGGTFVAAADVDGDGRADVVAATVTPAGPEVRAFSGTTGAVVANFLVSGPAFAGGVTVAAADVTGDRKAEVVVGAAGSDRVRTYDPLTGTVIAGPLGSFDAFGPRYAGGVFVGADSLAGDVDGDGTSDVAVGSGSGVARVRVLSGATGELIRDFLPFGPGRTGGARVALAYVNDDDRADLVVGTGPGGPAALRVFDGATGGQLPGATGAYEPFGDFTGGVFVAASNDPPVVTLSASASGAEGGVIPVTVFLSTVSSTAVDVILKTSSGSAVGFNPLTNSGDYLSQSVRLVISAGVLTATVQIQTLQDTEDEGDEFFTLSATSVVGGTLGTPATCTVQILDDDAVPTVSVGSAAQAEGSTGGTTPLGFAVTLSNPSSETVTVNYATSDGTAAAGSDYTSATGTVTFAPGQTLQTVTVDVAADTTYESDEAFTVTLTAPAGASLGTAAATGTIANDDSAPAVSVSGASVAEGNSGTATLTFDVALSAPSGLPVTVTYATSDGTATTADGDYTGATGTVVFAPGQTTATINVAVTGDATYEPDETLTLALSGVFGTVTATGTILNDDAVPTVSIGGASGAEGSTGGATPLGFAVTLSNPSSETVTVNYATSDGTAAAGSDYAGATGTVTFAPGQTLQTVTVAVAADTTYESDEAFTVALSNLLGAATGTLSATGTIANDDSAPAVSVSGASVAEGNAGTATLTFDLALSAPSGLPVTVTYATSDDTATTAGGDYTGATGTVVFAPGQTTATIGVAVTGDTTYESDETLTVTLSGASGASLGTAAATGTITNDDGQPTISITGASESEGDAGVTGLAFAVALSNPSSQTVTVNYATSDGTATTADDDYAGTGGVLTLTFAPGQTLATVTVDATGDTTYESDEAFTVTLSGAVHATIASGKGTATGTIVDDDLPEVTVAGASEAEGDTGTATLTFDVVLSNPSAFPVTVTYATSDGTATTADGDYTGATGTVVFAPGQTTATVHIAVTGDTTYESDEAFTVALSNLLGAATGTLSATGTITNDDSAPAASVSGASVAEGNSGTATLTFDVALSAPSGLPVTVTYATSDGTATTADGDYTGATGTVVFAPGQTTATVHIAVTGDTDAEFDESLAVTLLSPIGAALATSSATGTIVDDDLGATDVTPATVSGYGVLVNGNVTVKHVLDLDVSAIACDCQDPFLVYNSAEAAPAPVVKATIDSGSLPVPSHVYGTLTWDGATGSPTDYDLSELESGQGWAFGAQAPSTTVATGRHTYTLSLFLDYEGTENDRLVSVSGATYVVNRSAGPYGAGVAFSNTDLLIPITSDGTYPAGVLRAYGKGGWGFYEDTGSGTYKEPAGDGGSLVASGGGWVYSSPSGRVSTFNSSGQMTKWTHLGSGDTLTYTYDASGGVATMKGPDGGTATFTYASGRLSKIVAPGNRTVTVTMSGNNLAQVTNPDGGARMLAYDAGTALLTGSTFGYLQESFTYASGMVATMKAGPDPATTVSPANFPILLAGVPVLYAGLPGTSTDGAGGTTTQSFNPLGLPVLKMSPTGGVETFDRDTDGYVLKYTDPLERETVYTRDAAGSPLTQANPDGSTAAWVYGGANHSLTKYVDSNAGVWTYTNDATGNRLTQTDPLNRTTTYAYTSGLLTKATDPLGNVTTYLYDAQRRPTGALVGGAVTGTTGYDAAGNVTLTVDPLGNRTTMTYDGAGRVRTVRDALGSVTTYAYDGGGHLLSVTDPLGNVTSYAYDTAGRQVAEIDAFGTALARRTTTVYDAAGRPYVSIDAMGERTTTVYDLAGRVLATVDPLGNRTSYAYDAAGQLLTTTDPLGRVTTYHYDARGRQDAVTDALGRTTTSVYDANGNVVAAVDPLGHRTTTVYDGADRMTATVDALGNRTSYGYDAAGRLVTVTDPRGNVTTTGYDARGRVSYTQDALGNRVTFGYDAADNRTSVKDPLGNVVTTVYDKLNRAVATVEPLAVGTATSSVVHDAAGNQVETIDALGKRTTTVYDALNRPYVTIDALGNRTTVGYDADDRTVTITDARGKVATSVYDDAGRLVASIDALNRVTSYGYDAASNLVTVTDLRGAVTTTVYDALNRAVETVDAVGNRSTVVYDADGNVVATVDALGRRTTTGYDAADRPVTTTDALGNVWTTAYDAAGNVVASTDPLGHTTTAVYDALNRAYVSVDALGNRTTSTFDAAGNLKTVTDARNNTTTYGYDKRNLRATTTDALGNVWTTGYDAVGRAVASTDPLARTTTTVYDAAGQAVATLDALGKLWTTVYDAVGNATGTIDPLGSRTTTTYDDVNRPLTQTDGAAKVWATAYDDAAHTVTVTDPLGNRTTAVYDALDRQVVTVDALGNRTTTAFDAVGNAVVMIDALNRRTTMGYDALDRLVTVTDALGGVRTTAYDAAGNVWTSTDPLGRTTTTGYDAADRPVTRTDALGNVWTTAYDAVGNVVAATNPLGQTVTTVYDAVNQPTARVDALGNRTTTVYDAAGQAVAVVNALGNRSTTAYDKRGMVVATTDPLGNVWTTTYDDAGRAIAVIDPRLNRTTTVYDAADRPSVVIDALTRRTTAVYDDAGNRTATVDPLGYRHTVVYDALNRAVATVSPLGNRATTSYDAVGNVATEVDGLGKVTTYAYDALGRRVAVTDPLGFVTTTAYDAAGNVTRLTDAAGNATTWAYDALDRPVSETDPLGAVSTTAYDAAGRVASETDRLGRRRDFGYDAAGRATTEAWYAAGGALAQTQTWTYDAAGRMLTAQDPDGVYTLAYDAAGRVANVREPFGQVLTFAYDAAGNRTGVRDSLGGVTTLTFDALNRQLGEALAGSGMSDMRFEYAYDARGDVASRTANRNTSLSGAYVVATVAYTRDADGRVTNLKTTNRSGVARANYTYTYDAADQLASKVENGATTTFGYDAAGQLTGDGAATYGYDGAGNRTNAGYATGAGNQVTTDGTWTYTYDAEGNLAKKSKGTAAETWVYAYDQRNQLTTATKSATDGGAATTRVTYSYDAFGNRIQRLAWDGTTATTERYAVDGWDPAKPGAVGVENFDTWADLNGSNALVVRRVHGTGFNEVVGRQDASDVVTWYMPDRQGSVRLLVGNTEQATPLATAVYEAYGKLASGTLSDRFGYQGMELDGATGDYYDRARMYNPSLGRFTSADPKGFAAGDPNLYRFVENAPTNATDPSGMWLITDKDQLPYWAAIAEATGVDIKAKPRPGYHNLFILDAPRTAEAHNAIADVLRRSGLPEREVRGALVALYGGHLNEQDALKTSPNGDLSILRLNQKITFIPPGVEKPWKFHTQEQVDAAITALSLQPTGVEGVWVDPGGARMNGRVQKNHTARMWIQPDPAVPTLIPIRGPIAYTRADDAGVNVPNKGDIIRQEERLCPRPTNTLGPEPYDPAKEQVGKEVTGLAIDLLTLTAVGKLMQGAAWAGGPIVRWMFGGEVKAGAAALKAEWRMASGKGGIPPAAPGAGAPKPPIPPADVPVVRVYHKGELGPQLSLRREFSTGTDRAAVDALQRPGTVHEFAIPKDVLMRWEMEGKVRRLRDFDAVTGTINEELRFSPQVADELIKYRVVK